MSEHQQREVARVVNHALHHVYGDNADPYEDDPLRFGVWFDGVMVDVTVARVPAPTPEPEATPMTCPKCGSDNRAVRLWLRSTLGRISTCSPPPSPPPPGPPGPPTWECTHVWHTCPTCGSTDPKDRPQIVEWFDNGRGGKSPTYGPCPDDPFHFASTEPGDET